MNTNDKIRNFFNPNLNERLQSTETPSHDFNGDGRWNDEERPDKSSFARCGDDEQNEGRISAFHHEGYDSRLQIDYLRKRRLSYRFNKR
jgi:hypothetical protein